MLFEIMTNLCVQCNQLFARERAERTWAFAGNRSNAQRLEKTSWNLQSRMKQDCNLFLILKTFIFEMVKGFGWEWIQRYSWLIFWTIWSCSPLQKVSLSQRSLFSPLSRLLFLPWLLAVAKTQKRSRAIFQHFCPERKTSGSSIQNDSTENSKMISFGSLKKILEEVLFYPVMLSHFLHSLGNYTRRAIFPKMCRNNQWSVDFHCEPLKSLWLD